MELNKRNIEEYIDRFMEGETTHAEEQAIYRFFRTGDVPPHLKEYAPMFAWYEQGMQGTPGIGQEEKKPMATKKHFRLHIPMIAWSAGVAAMIVVALGLSFLFYTDSGKNGLSSDEWSCYEGSYIEVGGKRITDIKQILPCIIETLEEAERMEQLAQERVDEIYRSEEEIQEKELLVN